MPPFGGVLCMLLRTVVGADSNQAEIAAQGAASHSSSTHQLEATTSSANRSSLIFVAANCASTHLDMFALIVCAP